MLSNNVFHNLANGENEKVKFILENYKKNCAYIKQLFHDSITLNNYEIFEYMLKTRNFEREYLINKLQPCLAYSRKNMFNKIVETIKQIVCYNCILRPLCKFSCDELFEEIKKSHKL